MDGFLFRSSSEEGVADVELRRIILALGLERGERGGVLVDEHIWALGECAAVRGRCYGLVAPGYGMAETVAGRLAGRSAAPFDGSDTSTSLKLLGVHVATFGTTRPRGPAVEAVFAEGTHRYA